jgi:hypothetical protein
MPFDFFKKKNDKTPATDLTSDTGSKGGSLMKSMQGEGFDAQEKALKPEPEKAKKGPSLGERLGGLLGLNKSGAAKAERDGPKKPMPDELAKEYWKLAEGVFKLELDKFIASYSGPFMAFCIRDRSDENLECYLAIEARKSPRVIYETYLKAGAPREANIGQAARKELDELASKGRYKEMKFEPIIKELETTLCDPFFRMQSDELSLRAIFRQLSRMPKEPERIGEGY